MDLAKILAYLGDKDSALAEVNRLEELLPESKDTFDGPKHTEGIAEVYAALGDNERAIDLLAGLLKRPSNITIPVLHLNPAWDPLRQDPHFQALLNNTGKA